MRSAEVINVFIPIVMPPSPEDIGKIREYSPCDTVTTSILASENPPRIRQPVVDLRSGLTPSELRSKVVKAVSVREEVELIPTARIRELASITKTQDDKKSLLSLGIPIVESYRTNLSVASRLADTFLDPIPIRNVDSNQVADDLRDIGSGFLFKELKFIAQDPEKKTELGKMRLNDVALYCLTTSYEEEKKAVLSIRANERLGFVQRMGQMTDEQREMTSELLKRGLAPYIITNKDRALYAKQYETEREKNRIIESIDDTEEQETQDDEIGVGNSQYVEGAEEDALPNADDGNHGDLAGLPMEGRDYTDQPNLWDNEND